MFEQNTLYIPWYGFDDTNTIDIRLNKQNRNYVEPATTVHLMFSKDGYNHFKFEQIKRGGWILKNNIRVRETFPSTFFSVLQFPGVYAGIQHLSRSELCKDHAGINSNNVFRIVCKES